MAAIWGAPACGGDTNDESSEPRFALDVAVGGADGSETAGAAEVGQAEVGEEPADGANRQPDGSQPARACVDGHIEIRAIGGEVGGRYDCAAGRCSGASECVSDGCSRALGLAVGNLPIRIRADQAAYRGDWSPQRAERCSVGGGELQGVDAFFRLHGLKAGQRFVFDARQSDTPLAFYVMEGCERRVCRAAGVYDQNGDNVLRWSAERDGAVVVGVKSLTEPNRQSFGFVVERAEAVP